MIIKFPDERLHQKSAKVEGLQETRKIAEDLISTAKALDKTWKFWLGLSAPQIGYYKRIFILRNSYKNYLTVINPELLEKHLQIITPSRCYSVKGLFLIKSYLWIKLKFQDLSGKWQMQIFRGGKAVTVQQELDHLDGVLISDKERRILKIL